PLIEQTGVAYASQQDGVMHACGHDGHTTMGLGAAKIIAKHNGLNGKVVFIFQPAEENMGGAKRMVEEGLFERCPIDAVFGLHNLPGVPIGEIWAREGATSAAFDTFDISLEGAGGHGAMPDKAIDPIPAAAALIDGLNTIVSRNIAPLDSAVLSICAVNAGETYNVIPSTALIKGSCRSFNPTTQAILKDRIRTVVDGVALAFGVTADLTYEERYPAVINSPDETELIRSIAQDPKNGWSFKGDFEPLMGSEDFSFYLQKKPGCFFIIGNGNECGPLHSPTYNFNDEALPVGVAMWTQLAKRFLGA
ncbi:N-acetyl-L,L-diaminopimelate deacetylase, partial [hydrothermal vent metagenome]